MTEIARLSFGFRLNVLPGSFWAAEWDYSLKNWRAAIFPVCKYEKASSVQNNYYNNGVIRTWAALE